MGWMRAATRLDRAGAVALERWQLRAMPQGFTRRFGAHGLGFSGIVPPPPDAQIGFLSAYDTVFRV